MSKQNKIEDEVSKTLALWDEKDSLEANPFFYSRLEAEIRSMESEKSSSKKIFSMGILQPGVIALLIIINILAFIFTLEKKSWYEYSRNDYLKIIASEYSLNETSSNYLFTNE